MNRTGKNRLLKLADMLEEDASNKNGMKFDIGWVAAPSDEKNYIPDGYKPGLDCGTTGCAMGLAAISGRFKRAGLSYNIGSDLIETTWEGSVVDYNYAAVLLFDITSDEANWLFSPYSYPQGTTGAKGERTVAKRIRKLVAEHDKA